MIGSGLGLGTLVTHACGVEPFVRVLKHVIQRLRTLLALSAVQIRRLSSAAGLQTKVRARDRDGSFVRKERQKHESVILLYVHEQSFEPCTVSPLLGSLVHDTIDLTDLTEAPDPTMGTKASCDTYDMAPNAMLVLSKELQVANLRRKARVVGSTASRSYEFPPDYRKTRTLTPEEVHVVRTMLARKDNTVVATQREANINLTPKILACLAERVWLNDEVINFFFQLLIERNACSHIRGAGGGGDGCAGGVAPPLKVHFFNTFFMEKFLRGGYDYNKVKRWSKKAEVKICELDVVFAPVNVHGNHWCLGVVNFTERRFEYYDSLQGESGDVLVFMRRYVVDEAAQYGSDFDLSGWTDHIPSDIPTQDNGYDCGVFMCKYAEYLSERLEFDFSTADMPYFRRRLLLDLLAMKIESAY